MGNVFRFNVQKLCDGSHLKFIPISPWLHARFLKFKCTLSSVTVAIPCFSNHEISLLCSNIVQQTITIVANYHYTVVRFGAKREICREIHCHRLNSVIILRYLISLVMWSGPGSGTCTLCVAMG